MNRLLIPKDELLAYALVGLRATRDKLATAMSAIEERLSAAQASRTEPQKQSRRKTKRYISPEGRARQIAGTKRRWARWRRMQRQQGRRA